jgi:DNA polymerase-4
LRAGWPALAHVERALDGKIYCTLQQAPSWATGVAQAHTFIAALQSTGVQCGGAGLAAGRFPAACAATLAAQGTLHILPPGTEAAALAPRPITQLPDVSPQLLREFQQLRLFTLGDLAACPAPLVRAVFGPAVVRLQALARGEEPGAGLEPALIAQPLTATRSVLPGATATDTLAVLAALAGDLAATLGGAGRAATALTLTVGFAAGPPLHKTTRLPAPATDAPAIQAALSPLLVALLRARRSRPTALHLATTRSCDAVYQPPLPAPRSAPAPATRLQAVLADLQARFGPDVIQLGATRVPPSPQLHSADEHHRRAPALQVTHALHPSTHP